MRNNSGLALDLLSTTVWANTRRRAWAQALPTSGGQPPTPVVGAAHTLAVDGRHLAVGQGKGVLHPVPKALLEPGRMQPRKVPLQRVVRGDPVRQCQEGAQPLLVELAEERDDRQHQDVRQVVPFGAVAPRIFQGLQGFDQGRRHRAVREGCFAGLDPEPSNIGRCPSSPCRPHWMQSPSLRPSKATPRSVV